MIVRAKFTVRKDRDNLFVSHTMSNVFGNTLHQMKIYEDKREKIYVSNILWKKCSECTQKELLGCSGCK